MADIEITNQYASKQDIYSWFETDDFPTEAQFRATWDSYWHKSESIPMDSISGLVAKFNQTVSKSTFESHLKDENAHDTTLAKIDASNLSLANINLWKTKLGVGDLPPNVGTIDYVSPDGTAMVGNAYKKVADPNDGKVYVLNIDGSKVAADTFGKNITNSSNTTNGSYIQTQRASDTFDWETSGARYAIKSLPDKSADAAFDDFVGKNSQGQLAKVGYPAFYKSFSNLTSLQAVSLAQLLAGGQGSDGAPNVNLISPPIIQNQYDSVEYVLLRGVNLKLNTQAMKIEILKNGDQTLVATIPNSQIQLSEDGTTLIFYYNFHNFQVGDYVIKLTSGAKVYITTLTLKIVPQIENINLNAVTWDFLYGNGGTQPSTDIGSGPNVNFYTPPTGRPLALSIKSSQLFAQGEDFYIEMVLNFGGKGGRDESKSYIGLGYSSTVNSLLPLSLINLSYSFDYSERLLFTNNNTASFSQSTPSQLSVIFIKTGNLFRTIVGGSDYSTILSNNSGYSIFFSIVTRGSDNQQQVSSQIVKAFKFN